MLAPLLKDVQFEWPWMLLFLILLPFLAWQMFWSNSKPFPKMKVAEMSPLSKGYNAKTFFRKLPDILRFLAFCIAIIVAARPVVVRPIEINGGDGIEIVLCMDVSGSMLAEDFSPNRLVAAQEVAKEFIYRRKGDRIGLVAFAGQSLTLCPITGDHLALLKQLETINYGLLNDGTSIGSGLASAVERLRTGEAVSKVIVLLTDGEDTGGKMDPVTAKEIAKTYGIKVYTIGIGSIGYANIPYQSVIGQTVMEKEKVSIDEALLKEIATETGGAYYRAKNIEELENIYTAIDKLEKSNIQTTYFQKKEDRAFPLILCMLILLLADWTLRYTWLRSFP